MVIDLKYHLTTIIAIFLALGIGILVGSAMIGDDGIVREQQKLIVQIEDDLQGLRSQNNQFRQKVTALEVTLAEQEQFVDLLFQDAISGQLSGLQGLLVGYPEEDDPEKQVLMKTLRLAGMEITEFVATSEAELPGETQGPPMVQSEETQWDLCFLMGQSLPRGLEEVIPKEKVYRPILKQLASKKGMYELITSLRKQMESKMAPVNEKREVWHDLSTDTSVQ